MTRLLGFSTVLLALSGVWAEFPAPYNSEPGNPSPMSPKEALKALKLPEGFSATLFAAEPDVQNPVAMAWDGRGRMWVAENYTYAERAKRFDLGLKDRVVILEDKDWDGTAETRKVFTEDVQMLTSVEIGRGGVWLMCPPQVVFIPDANGDDVADGEPEVVLDGFTVAKDNYHNFANGLRFGPDGWLYGRCGHSCPGKLGVPGTPVEKRIPMKGGIWRFHPEKKIVEVLTHGTTNPWGHDWDQNGEMFFINTVTGHLWHLIHGAHLVDSHVSNPLIYERLDTIADHYHYDRTGSWQDSREGKANSLGGGHAHIGMMIYQADQWPEIYRNKLFTLNMHGRRANVERLERNGSGYVGKHEPDVFLSDDPWFRGIEISTGPDGSGFILDWSDTGECHESTGVHRTSGRIFRISYGEPKKPEKPFAWRKPLPKADLSSTDEHPRAVAIRELFQFSPIDAITGPLPNVTYPAIQIDLAKVAAGETSAFVRLQLASVLQRLPLEKRSELAVALLSHAEDANDPFLPHLVWVGISPLPAEALVAIARRGVWPKTLGWIARKLATQPQALSQLLTIDSSETVLAGMAEAFKGIRKAPKPENWDQIASASKSPHARDLSILFGDGRALDDVKRIALDSKADVQAREAALKTLIENKPDDLRAICVSLLDVRVLNATAARGLALFDDPEIGKTLAKNYRKFAVGIMDTLVSRPSLARAMLSEMAAGRIPRADLSAFQMRQIRAFQDEGLNRQLAEAWGESRETATDKKQLIEKLKAELTPNVLAKANLKQGRVYFSALCGTCHTMYGQGGKIGPDLTGSGRANLDYLLENIADPSGVVSADYRMSVLTHKDGRVLSGTLVDTNERTLTLRTMAESITLDRAEVIKIETSPLSLMPEGLLMALNPEQVRDLVGYLMHPVQVSLPSP
jgi:putative membrane-bound dehydrogenase-like protein